MPTKLNEIKNSVQPFLFPPNTSRKHETSINRLRIGHNLITHSHLMKKDDPPICSDYRVFFTVKHIIIEFRIYDKERE